MVTIPARTEIKQFIKSVRQVSVVPGLSVAIDVGGTATHLAAGYRNLEDEAPMSPNSLFELGSLKAFFLALVSLELYEAGALDLDASVAKYLPELAGPVGNAVQIKHLLNYTAGYQDVNIWDPDIAENYTYDDFASSFNQRKMLFSPGTVFSESYSCSTLLEKVVEKITSIDAWTLCCSRLLKPLDIETSDQSTSSEVNTVQSYDMALHTGLGQSFDTNECATPIPSAWCPMWRLSRGGPCISIKDAVKVVAAAVHTDAVLSPRTRSLLAHLGVDLPRPFHGKASSEAMLSFGLGCARFSSGALGVASVSGSGQTMAIHFDISNRVTIGVGINCEVEHVRDFVIRQLYRSMLPNSETPSLSEPQADSFSVEELVGTYEGAEGHVVIATLHQDVLTIATGANPATLRNSGKFLVAFKEGSRGLERMDQAKGTSVGLFRDPSTGQPCIQFGSMAYSRQATRKLAL